jgi:hypothetical protein
MAGWFSRLRTRRLRFAAIVGVVAALSFTVVAIATHGDSTLAGSNFEIDDDANLKVDHTTPPSLDWNNVADINNPDTESGSLDESFGQGTKEDTTDPTIVDGGIPPNKSDLKRFGVYQEGSTSSGFLNLYWSRVQDPSGTTNMDFELNKLACPGTIQNPTPAHANCSANGVTPKRSAGDFLVQYDLSQGGTNPVLFVSRWVTTGPKSQCEAGSTPCWSTKDNLSEDSEATGSINTLAIPADQSEIGAQDARTFGEAQVSLAALFRGTTGCASIGSAYLKSRSSDSFTAALKDFVPPVAVNITNCGTVNITKTNGSGGALNGATFTLFTDTAPLGGAAPHGAEDTATSLSCTTAGSGSNAGKCSITNVPFGQYWVVETGVPSGFTAAADQNIVVSAANPTVSLSFDDLPLKGSLKIVKKDDANNLMDGVTFTLTGTSTTGESVNSSCTTGQPAGTPSGECTISNIPVGSNYTLSEGSVPAGYAKDPSFPKTVAITSNTTTTVNAVNPRLHRVIVLVCHDGTNELDSFNVDLGADTKASISGVPSSVSGKTPAVTEAELCALGGASFGGLAHGDKAVTVHVDSH